MARETLHIRHEATSHPLVMLLEGDANSHSPMWETKMKSTLTCASDKNISTWHSGEEARMRGLQSAAPTPPQPPPQPLKRTAGGKASRPCRHTDNERDHTDTRLQSVPQGSAPNPHLFILVVDSLSVGRMKTPAPHRAFRADNLALLTSFADKDVMQARLRFAFWAVKH